VLALHNPVKGKIKDLRRQLLATGDQLVLQGEREALEEIARLGFITDLQFLPDGVEAYTDGPARLLPVRVPEGSVLADRDLVESRLGNAFGLTVVGIVREARNC
jgi:hypothetical protein